MTSITPPIAITSPGHLTTLLNAHTYLIADFHATWCGPCKAIAPLYSQLATTHSRPSRITFVKIDVDAQSPIAKKYSVSAMPTFLVFKNGSVVETIRGADAAGLKRTVEKAALEAGKGEAKSKLAFQSQGRVLGSVDAAGGGADASGSVGRGVGDMLFGLRVGHAGSMVDTVVRFVGLYLTSLISLDGYAAAEASPFNVKNRPR